MPKLTMRPTLKEMVLKEKKYRAMQMVIQKAALVINEPSSRDRGYNITMYDRAVRDLNALEKEGGV